MSRRDASIYVGRLAKNTRTRDLEDIFEPYGRMHRCDIKYGAEMAYAFIDFEDKRDAEDCVKYEHGREINGQSIIVEWAKGGKDKRMSYDECFRCRRTGHWARDCPDVRFGRGGGGGYGGGGRGGGRWRSPSPRRRSRSRSRDRRRRSRSRSRDHRRKRSRSNSDNRKRSRSGSRKSRSASDERKKDRRSKSGSRDKRKSVSGSKSRSRSQSPRRSKSGSKSKSHSKSPRRQLDNNDEQQANGDSFKDERGADGEGEDYGDEEDGPRSRSRSGSKE